MFKVNNKDTKKSRFRVYVVELIHNTHMVLAFPLLNLSKYMKGGLHKILHISQIDQTDITVSYTKISFPKLHNRMSYSYKKCIT